MNFAESCREPVRELAQQLQEKLQEVEREMGQVKQGQDLFPRVAAAIDACLERLEELRLWGSENRLPSSELWNVVGHFLSRGWLLNQARTKPRGYAGDHEMLARIYENRLCDDPFGRLIDRYFQAQAAPQAVRNRMAMIADWIVAAAAHIPLPSGEGGCLWQPGEGLQSSRQIAIFGSAFGLEIRDALQRLDEPARARLQVTLLDLDPAAVDFARGQLAHLLPP